MDAEAAQRWEALEAQIRRPIPGTPEGKTLRRCQHDGPFEVVRAFHGIIIYQCMTCRKCSEVETRTGRTCLNCGKPLTGRQVNWCCEDHGREFACSKDRDWWRRAVLKRDGHTCQRCGWKDTPEGKQACQEAYAEVAKEERTKPRGQWRSSWQMDWEAMRRSGYRQLEAHHVHPLEWGGAEFDLENGITYCHICHDAEHRALNAQRRGQG